MKLFLAILKIIKHATLLFLSFCCAPKRVSLKHDGPDVTAYTDGTASLVADGTDYKDGTAIQLLVEQTEQPIQSRQPFMEQTGQPLYRQDSYVGPGVKCGCCNG